MTTQFQARSEQTPTLWIDRTATPSAQPQYDPQYDRRSIGVGVNARKLWAGGAASALVASLVALVGVLACRWLFALSVLAPHQNGYSTMPATALILIGFLGAIAATGLTHLLMLGTARPRLFFGWIVALVTTIAVIFPFGTAAPLDAKIATAVVSLAIGTVIGTLVSGVAARSVR
ncbi:MAG TPA: DUF6069 family protein [Streptosporangiaceae bacterium]|jgi:hypothetical protein|nr:DUF6069 family protein [Streptosporangiaceae bacterium]